jgi:hypothetical protein
MKKSDLKTGMLVQYNNGDYSIVLKDVETQHYGHQELFFADVEKIGFMTGDSYNDNLVCEGRFGSNYTIKKVYSAPRDSMKLNTSTEERKLLWEREPALVEMTLEEACKKLRETVGKPVKITL